MDDTLLFTTGPVVATIPDCIRVTMVLPDIFGLASSQRTQLNVHTCTRAHTQRCSRDPCSQWVFVSSLIGSSESGGPPPLVHLLSCYFSELSPGTLLFFLHLLRVWLGNLWNTIFVSTLRTWHWDNQQLTVWNPSGAPGLCYLPF